MKVAVPEGGLRERNKAEKLRVIRRAARELFIEKGYDDTTTREIARRAGVGLGTLFTYAVDKRDLLFLIFNDELELVAETAFGAASGRDPLPDQIVGIFREFYVFFARQPHLARFMLRELAFYVEGPEARRFQNHLGQNIARLAALVRRAKAEGRIVSREDDTVIAEAIFALYQAAIRRWLREEKNALDLERALRVLRRQLELLMNGLAPPRS